MALPDIFSAPVVEQLEQRLNKLTPESEPLWGSMNVAQMLAHCNVTYEMVYEDKHPKPKGLMKWLLRMAVKKKVTDELPYKHSLRTAPQFLVAKDQDFERERGRLISFLRQTQELGTRHFHQKESHSFGPLTSAEWNNMFYKHLDHHLRQFGV